MSEYAPRDSGLAHLIFPLLVAAFGVAASATVVSERRVEPAEAPAPALPMVSLASAPPRAAPARDKLVAVQVADVLLPEGDGASVALLMDNGATWVLPVVVESGFGRALRSTLKREEPAKGEGVAAPASHDARDRIRAMGGEVDHVEVEQAGDDFRTSIVVKRGHEQIRVDATPGEGLATAVQTGTPVYVAGELLMARGISREAVSRRPGGIPSNLKTPERL